MIPICHLRKSAGLKNCDMSDSATGLFTGICDEEQANLFFCFHLSLSIDSRIIFRLQKNRITNPVSGFLFD